MTETNEHMNAQERLSEAIDRMMAGRDIDPAGQDPETRRLLQIAAELKAGAPLPSGQLGERIEAIMQESGAAPAGECVAAPRKEQPHSRWLPGWLTMPRAAGAAAALLIGLGVIGLTGAIIRGSGPEAIPEAAVSTRSQPAGDSSSLGEDSVVSSPASEGAGAGQAPGVAPDSAFWGTEELAPPQATGSTGVATADSAALAPLPEEQRVIETADYSIEVPQGEFQNRFNAINGMAGKYGGFVVSASTSKTGVDEPPSGFITFRIANIGDNFTQVQTELEGMGTVTMRNISGQDVTGEFVDLESRLRNSEAQAAQLLSLMQKAQTVDEILMVQSRLSVVQAEIEQIKGRIEFMQSRTDFATVTVNLTESGHDEEEQDEDDGIDWGFVDSLKYAGWLAVQTVNFVLVSLGVIIPAGLMLALLSLLVYRLWRRRERQ